VSLLPVEVGWWFVHRCGWATTAWCLVLSNRPELVAGLAVRAATGVNLVWGILRPDTAVADLKQYDTELRALIKICDGLPPLRWDQGASVRPTGWYWSEVRVSNRGACGTKLSTEKSEGRCPKPSGFFRCSVGH
jgi:hypothetical protein